jgi:hypothetical protein
MTSFLDAFTTAHNARDVAAALACFTDDVDYRDIFFGDCHGHTELGAMFTRTFAESAQHTWTIMRSLVTADAIVAEWEFDYTVSDAVPAGGGRRLVLPGVSWFELRGERCFRYREFFDRAATLHAQGVPAEKVATIVARRSTVRVLEPSEG